MKFFIDTSPILSTVNGLVSMMVYESYKPYRYSLYGFFNYKEFIFINKERIKMWKYEVFKY